MGARPVKPETVRNAVAYLREQGFSAYATAMLDMQDRIRELEATARDPSAEPLPSDHQTRTK